MLLSDLTSNATFVAAGRGRQARALRRIAMLSATALCGFGVLVAQTGASKAHGVAGDRFFPATLETDDPFVADEAAFPTISYVPNPGNGNAQNHEWDFNGEIFKTIFPNFGLGVSDQYQVQQVKGGSNVQGWANLNVLAKYQFYKSDADETIMSVGLNTIVGGTGASRRLGQQTYMTYTPILYAGKGLGDLPDSMKWFKPIAVTGTLGLGIPDKDHDTNSDGSITRHSKTVNWGIAFQYSIPYLQSVVQDVGIGKPFDRLIPVIEFANTTPIEFAGSGQNVGVVAPGVLWTGKQIQLGIEAVIPFNGKAQRAVGAIAQLHFYMDDILPSVFGRPVSEMVFGK